MNIKKIFCLGSFILINVVLASFSYTSHEMAKFILLFLVAEIAICEMVLRTNHKQLLKSIRLILYIFSIIIIRLMDSPKLGAIAIGIVIMYSVVIDYLNNRNK